MKKLFGYEDKKTPNGKELDPKGSKFENPSMDPDRSTTTGTINDPPADPQQRVSLPNGLAPDANVAKKPFDQKQASVNAMAHVAKEINNPAGVQATMPKPDYNPRGGELDLNKLVAKARKHGDEKVTVHRKLTDVEREQLTGQGLNVVESDEGFDIFVDRAEFVGHKKDDQGKGVESKAELAKHDADRDSVVRNDGQDLIRKRISDKQ